MNPYLLLGLGIAWLASLVGVGYWQHGAGADEERVAWQERELKQVTKAANRIRQIHEDARAKERKAAEDLAALAAQFEQEKADVTARKDRLIAQLRRGDIRLRFPTAGALPANRSPAGAAAAPAGERDGRAPTELPGPAAEFLLSLASESDEVVHQLSACQAIVRRYRQPPP